MVKSMSSDTSALRHTRATMLGASTVTRRTMPKKPNTCSFKRNLLSAMDVTPLPKLILEGRITIEWTRG
jgi:hypothetical protein